MKSLIIIANPSKTSFSHAMADTYSKKSDDFEILDLYDFKQGFLKYESVEELKMWNADEMNKINEVQKKITECDELVFFFPVWWWWIPAILKNFFDSNLSAGFAFNFLKWGKVEKLLTDKTTKIYCTCDAPGFVYKIPFLVWINLKKYLDRAVLWFCGIQTTHFQLVWSLSKKTSEQRTEILQNI